MDWDLILIALFGGLAGSFIDLFESQGLPKERRPALDWLYWTKFIVYPLLGMGLVYVYLKSDLKFNGLSVFHVGISAPLILKGLANSIPKGTINTKEGA